jgi:WxL Interacting Protein, peptidoglycan binding domain
MVGSSLRRPAVMAAALLLGLALPRPALAAGADAGAPQLQVVGSFPHGYMEFNATPGQTLQAAVDVADGGTVPATFLLTAVDGYTSTAGGVVYGTRQTPLLDGPAGNGEFGAGSWISLDRSQVTLNPNQAVTVHLTIRVPAAAHPGDWVGALDAENPTVVQPAGGSGGASVGVKEATAIAVVVHVAGPVSTGTMYIGKPWVSVVGIEEQLNIPLRYTGDILVKPLFSFRILDASGSVVYSHSGRFDTFMPHTTITYQVVMPHTLVPGSYTFTGQAGPDGHEQSVSYPLQIGTSPPVPSTGGGAESGPATAVGLVSLIWLICLVAGLALVLPLLAILAWRRRCSHCHALRLWGTLRVEDYQEIATCQGCRNRARERQTVRLCSACYRTHVRGATGAALVG